MAHRHASPSSQIANATLRDAVTKAVSRSHRSHLLGRARTVLSTAAAAASLGASSTLLAQDVVEIEASSLLESNGGDGSAGFFINGIDEGDQAAYDVAFAGDLNGDGFDDIVLGAPGARSDGITQVGEAYVVFGRADIGSALFNLSTLDPANGGDGSAGFIIRTDYVQDSGGVLGDLTGASVAPAGDINNDGIDDLIIGAPEGDANGSPDDGLAYVIYGTSGGFPAVINLANLRPERGGDGSVGTVISPAPNTEMLGAVVAGAGDVNGDGIDDLAVSARTIYGNRSLTYLVYGREGGLGASVATGNLESDGGGDGSEGVFIMGPDPSPFETGRAIGVGDVNGDGLDDLLLSVPDADRYGAESIGVSLILFGREGGFPADVDLTSLTVEGAGDGSEGTILVGEDDDDLSGISIAALGDFNGDGGSDFLVGAPRVTVEGESFAGRSYLVFGASDKIAPPFFFSSLLPEDGGDGSAGLAFQARRTCSALASALAAEATSTGTVAQTS